MPPETPRGPAPRNHRAAGFNQFSFDPTDSTSEAGSGKKRKRNKAWSPPQPRAKGNLYFRTVWYESIPEGEVFPAAAPPRPDERPDRYLKASVQLFDRGRVAAGDAMYAGYITRIGVDNEFRCNWYNVTLAPRPGVYFMRVRISDHASGEVLMLADSPLFTVAESS